MGQIHSGIDDALRDWIAAQRVFFIATAPSGETGHVNCSPRGGDPLVVLDANTVAWLDRAGSGTETAAHLRPKGRIVVMLCAFDGPPRIVRLHGRGEVLRAGTPAFTALRARLPGPALGVRAIVQVRLTRVADSCGFGVPRMRHEGDREQLAAWAQKKGEAGIAAYVREKNVASIDGLPGIAAD